MKKHKPDPQSKRTRMPYVTKQRWKGLTLFHRREAEGRPRAAKAAAQYYFILGAMIAATIAALIYMATIHP